MAEVRESRMRLEMEKFQQRLLAGLALRLSLSGSSRLEVPQDNAVKLLEATIAEETSRA